MTDDLVDKSIESIIRSMKEASDNFDAAKQVFASQLKIKDERISDLEQDVIALQNKLKVYESN